MENQEKITVNEQSNAGEDEKGQNCPNSVDDVEIVTKNELKCFSDQPKLGNKSPKPTPRPSRALLLLLVTVVIGSLVFLYASVRPLFKAPYPVSPAIPNNSSTPVPSTQKQSSAPDPANKSYSITGLRESLSLTNEEEKFLRERNYIKAYLDSSDKTEYEDMLERIKNILEKLRCRKEVVEGIFVRENHGANGGGFDIKTRTGDIRSFYWSGSWGHLTIIMKGSFIPLELKIGEEIKVYFCEKTTALGIFK